MMSLSGFLLLIHLVGLAMGMGSATAKLTLLLKSGSDSELLRVYPKVAKILTRFIMIGMVLLTASGITWLFRGEDVSTWLVVKLVLVGMLWTVGPVIDKVFEPVFKRLTPPPGKSATPAFLKARRNYVAIEAFATSLFYAIVVFWLWGY